MLSLQIHCCIWLLTQRETKAHVKLFSHKRKKYSKLAGDNISTLSGGTLTDGESISKSLGVKMSFTAAVPCPGVAIVSNLYMHLVQARRQHGEQTGDVRRCPLHGDTLLPAHEHHAIIGLSSQVGTLNGENSMSYTKGDKKTSFCQLSAKIISTCHVFIFSLTGYSVLFTIITRVDTLVSSAQTLQV